MKKLFAAWLCAAVVACAAAPKQAMMAPAPAPAAMTSNPHDEIERLSNDIEQERTQMNLPPAAEPMTAHAPTAAQQVCEPVSETCKTSCTLGDSICKNADSICKLADGMPGDDWAAGKCATAKQTCSDAHKRCCECT